MNKYSSSELKEFEDLILEKLEVANKELKVLKEMLNKGVEDGVVYTEINNKVLEDGAGTAQKENINHLAVRQQRFVNSLESALIRIKMGTYGICSVTGELIPKERLRLVPHTTLSIEAKLKQ